MIVFKDVCLDDEVITDAFKYEYEDDDFMIKWEGHMTDAKQGEGIDDSLIGGNRSQDQQCCDEDAQDQPQDITGIDLILRNQLIDYTHLFPNKKAVQMYLKTWAKKTAGILKDKEEKTCDEFKKCCQEKLKHFVDKWSPDASVYSKGEIDFDDPTCAIFIGQWHDTGKDMTLYGVKLGLYEERF